MKYRIILLLLTVFVLNALQNVDVTENRFYDNTPFSAGEDVAPIGDVIVKKGHKLIVKNGPGGVFIDVGFECEKGAIFEVK